MHLGGCKADFVCVMIAGGVDSREDVTEFRFIVQQSEQGLADGPDLADPQNVFRGGIDPLDQKIVIQQDDTRAQAAEDVSGQRIEAAAVAGCTATAIAIGFVVGFVFRQRPGRPMIVFCCT